MKGKHMAKKHKTWAKAPVKAAPAPVAYPKREPYSNKAHGLSEKGLMDLIAEGEQMDRGTTRYPWPDDFKASLLPILACQNGQANLKAVINAEVMKRLGGGLLGRGPFAS